MANPQLIPGMITQEQRELLQTETRLKELALKTFAEKFGIPTEEPFEEEYEVKNFLHRGIKAILPGRCDYRRYWPGPKIMVTLDYKNGRRAVTHAAANLQMRTYALMGAEEKPVLVAGVAIIQPRLNYDYRLTMAAYSALDLKLARVELYGILDKTEDPDAPLHASEDACRWCKAKLLCPAYKATFLAIREQSAVALGECSDDQLDGILVAIQFADFVKDQARDEARRRIGEGGFHQWTLGKESETPKITDTIRARHLLTVNGFNSLTETEVFECATLGIGKLEEKYAEKGMKKVEAKKLVREILADVLEFTVRKATLTRVKDGGAAALEE
jgi:hypothetical protein